MIVREGNEEGGAFVETRLASTMLSKRKPTCTLAELGKDFVYGYGLEPPCECDSTQGYVKFTFEPLDLTKNVVFYCFGDCGAILDAEKCIDFDENKDRHGNWSGVHDNKCEWVSNACVDKPVQNADTQTSPYQDFLA